MVAQPWIYYNHWIVHLKRCIFMVLDLNKEYKVDPYNFQLESPVNILARLLSFSSYVRTHTIRLDHLKFSYCDTSLLSTSVCGVFSHITKIWISYWGKLTPKQNLYLTYSPYSNLSKIRYCIWFSNPFHLLNLKKFFLMTLTYLKNPGQLLYRMFLNMNMPVSLWTEGS